MVADIQSRSNDCQSSCLICLLSLKGVSWSTEGYVIGANFLQGALFVAKYEEILLDLVVFVNGLSFPSMLDWPMPFASLGFKHLAFGDTWKQTHPVAENYRQNYGEQSTEFHYLWKF